MSCWNNRDVETQRPRSRRGSSRSSGFIWSCFKTINGTIAQETTSFQCCMYESIMQYLLYPCSTVAVPLLYLRLRTEGKTLKDILPCFRACTDITAAVLCTQPASPVQPHASAWHSRHYWIGRRFLRISKLLSIKLQTSQGAPWPGRHTKKQRSYALVIRRNPGDGEYKIIGRLWARLGLQ